MNSRLRLTADSAEPALLYQQFGVLRCANTVLMPEIPIWLEFLGALPAMVVNSIYLSAILVKLPNGFYLAAPTAALESLFCEFRSVSLPVFTKPTEGMKSVRSEWRSIKVDTGLDGLAPWAVLLGCRRCVTLLSAFPIPLVPLATALLAAKVRSSVPSRSPELGDGLDEPALPTELHPVLRRNRHTTPLIRWEKGKRGKQSDEQLQLGRPSAEPRICPYYTPRAA